MNNILKKPYTNEQYAQFAGNANQNGQRIETDNTAAYALFDNEAVKNGEIVDISDTDEYKTKKLAEAKIAKITENEQKRSVEFITISLGRMKTQTPLGDLKTAMPLYEKIAQAQGGLPAGAVRLYDQDGNMTLSPALTLEQVDAILLEISMAYIAIDQKSTQYCSAIDEAQTLAELENINLEY